MQKLHLPVNDADNRDYPLIAANEGEIGCYFMDVYHHGLQQWERWILFLLCRSNGYRNNDQLKLLELAKDIRATHQGQIDLVQKYPDLFLPKAADMEREVVGFLDTTIIPYLVGLIGIEA